MAPRARGSGAAARGRIRHGPPRGGRGGGARLSATRSPLIIAQVPRRRVGRPRQKTAAPAAARRRRPHPPFPTQPSLPPSAVIERASMDAPTARSATNSVLAVILGGGAGTRLYPLTKQRAKPAVPIGGAYRLIDVPMSNCINSGINKIYVLTQVGGEEGKVFFWGGRRRAKISRPDFCPDPLPPSSSVQLHLPQPPPGPNLQRGLRRPLRRRRLRGGRKIVFSFLFFFFSSFLLFFFSSFFSSFFSCRPRAHNRTHAPPHPTPPRSWPRRRRRRTRSGFRALPTRCASTRGSSPTSRIGRWRM